MNEYTQKALNLLEDYFILRTTYVYHSKTGVVLPKDEEEYLAKQAQILELMGDEDDNSST